MIVLSESSDQLEPSASSRDIKISTEAAVVMGHRVYYIPQDFTRCETADNALSHVKGETDSVSAIWIGYIPTFERYQAIYHAGLRKNIKLLNTPEEHLVVQEFDRAYPLIRNLTPETMAISSVDQCDEVAARLGFPLFVKGAVQSLKAEGPESCVANDVEALRALTARLLRLKDRSRGRIIARRFIKLRHSRTSGQGLPMGREFRVFLYNHRLMGLGYYWHGEDELKPLAPSDRDGLLSIAIEASRRIGVPYIALDVGQLESGEWIIIETGDPQFCGLCQIPVLQLWNELKNIP